MRIKFSARAWMLSAVTGLVFLPHASAGEPAPRSYRSQRQPATAKSGTASETAETERTQIQKQLDGLYARFGNSTTESQSVAAKEANPPANTLARQSNSGRAPAKAPASAIRQASAEVVTEGKEPGRLQDHQVTRRAIEQSRPAMSGSKPSTNLGVRQVSGATAAVPSTQQSDVQRKLEELYRSDGRQMPPMQLQQLPERDLKQHIPPLPQQTGPRPSATQMAGSRFTQFFKNISPFKSDKPNDERPKKIEPMTPEMLRQQQALQQQTQSNPQGRAKPAAAPVVVPPLPAPPPAAPAAPAAQVAEPAQPPRLLLPENTTTGRALAPRIADLPEFKPVVDSSEPAPEATKTEPLSANPPAVSDDAPKSPDADAKTADSPATATPNGDELQNAFPELSEEEADGKAKPNKAESENPFTGLKLDKNESGGSPASADSKAPLLPESPASLTAPLKSDDDDDEDDDKEMDAEDASSAPLKAVIVPQPLAPATPTPAPIVAPAGATPPAIVAPAAASAALPTPSVEDEQAAKLKKIAERSNLTGLRGFCPVVLRDERGLKDSKPEFKASFLGKEYQFSSAEARDKFIKNPKPYAPAAGGKDVVLAKTKSSDAEGSLEHAAWFKDRLYLFSSAQTKEDFELAPNRFLVVE